VKIIQTRALTSKEWSGGTTTELFIHPEGSSFVKGNYQLRISLATVDKEKTVFTSLPNTQRTLMVLKGTQLLQHRGQHTADLSAFQQDSFSGNWTTDCKGLSTNFNVMTQGQTTANVESHYFEAATFWELDTADVLYFLYIVKGELEIHDRTIVAEEAISIASPAKLMVKNDTQFVLVTYPLNGNF
jgi:environmental stress-induced protein Ves